MSDIRLRDGSKLHPLLKDILLSRGICDHQSIVEFLNPKLSDLPDPFLLKDMDSAAGLICDALTQDRDFLIWGDYDVDGTTATALLVKFFTLLGKEVAYHIPNRLTEGYGLQEEGLKQITENRDPEKCILITVDNGITAHKAVSYARELGYTVIVTDHHLSSNKRVEAHAVINPNQEGCSFPDKNMAGVGIAFYLAMAVRSRLMQSGYFTKNPPLNLKTLLDLVAIGTVADMVVLGEVNRVLVKAGLEVIAGRGNCGLTALCQKTNIDPGFLRSEDISFQLAPKINAAGRLGDAKKAVRLFLASSKSEAILLARELVANNEIRKDITIRDFSHALDEHLEAGDNHMPVTTVVAGAYHVGVAGIVASKLVEKFRKPAVVLCETEDGTLKGSARSVQGIDLHRALADCHELLLGFGGHKMAGGMSMLPEKLNDFKVLFDDAVKNQGVAEMEEDSVFDADIEVGALFCGQILRQIHMMEPFGQGNPQLIFRDTSSRFSELSQIGKDKNHLRFSLKGNNRNVQGVAFGFGENFEKCLSNRQREIFYTPSMNYFRGKRSWQVRVTGLTF